MQAISRQPNEMRAIYGISNLIISWSDTSTSNSQVSGLLQLLIFSFLFHFRGSICASLTTE